MNVRLPSIYYFIHSKKKGPPQHWAAARRLDIDWRSSARANAKEWSVCAKNKETKNINVSEYHKT